MTAIEFYDRTPIENAISSLTVVPDKIIFISSGNIANDFLKDMKEFIALKKLKTKVDIIRTKRNNLNDIVKKLSDIVNTESDCVFDLTGGDDLTLVAMGIVYQKYPEKNIKIQRFNVNKCTVTDCDNDGCVIYKGEPELTVEENIVLHGAAIKYSNNPQKGTYTYEYTEEFIDDINVMWGICADNPGYWNARINLLGKVEEYYGGQGMLTISFNKTRFERRLDAEVKNYVEIKYLNALLSKLSAANLLSYTITNEDYTITFKNEGVKHCLVKAGTILEQKVTVAALKSTDETGKNTYCSVMSGVYIDWDGDLTVNSKSDTKNEIDVIAMHGIIPLFISCKNGDVDDDELYKLDAVANRFGGLYVKKVLIATYLKNKKGKALTDFTKRAEDMGITFIKDVHIGQNTVEKVVNDLCSKNQD